MRRTLLIICMIACFGQAHGEHLILDEIKVKGVRESPREESLTIREVQESPARDVGEALRQVEGLDIVRKGAIANDIVLRGMQRDNINVLLDGTRLHGACPNRMDSPAFHIDFAEVDQIRIIKGPYDLENAGSMGGLVDVQSKKPGPGPRANASITAGSYDMIHASGTASYGGETYDGLLGYAFKKSGVPRDGKNRPITDIYPDNSPSRYKKTDATAYLINSGWVKAGWKPTEKGRGEISYSYQDAEHVLYPYLLMDADFDRTHRLNAVYTQENVSPGIRELKLQTYWDKVTHRMDDRLRHSADPTAIVTQNYSMQTDAWTETIGVKANASLGAGPGALKTGLDYYNLNWNGVNRLAGFGYETRAFIPDVTTNNIGIFTEYELPVGEELTLKGGVRGDLAFVDAGKLREARLDFANLYYPGTRDSRFFGEVTGNVQATWKPVEGLEVFAGLGRGSRPPAADELYINLQRPMAMPNWIGNPRLTPTETSQADIGVKYGTEKYYVNASAFYSYVHDYITVVGIPADDDLKPAFSYRNVDATLVGGELGSQVSLPADLFLKASLSYTEGKNLTYNTPLPEIPPLRGTVSLRYDNDTWFAEILENMAARQDRVDPEVKEQPTAGWATTDIKAGLRTKNVSLFAGVNNLFDKLYYSHLSHRRDPFASGFRVPEFGRNFYVTATVKF